MKQGRQWLINCEPQLLSSNEKVSGSGILFPVPTSTAIYERPSERLSMSTKFQWFWCSISPCKSLHSQSHYSNKQFGYCEIFCTLLIKAKKPDSLPTFAECL